MKTILVVDDEFGIAETLSSVLTDEGYRVMVAMNGEQGLARMKDMRPDLVIVDFMMPVKSGPDMVNEMRASEELARVPIILMSAVSEAMVREECAYTAFLRKPFDIDALLATVASVLREAP